MSPPEAIAALAFFGGAFWVVRPIAGALAKRIAGEHRPPAATDAGEREEILTELQQLRHEVGELAERVDFTERLLAREREVAKLDRGH
jgi:hypothetical protein